MNNGYKAPVTISEIIISSRRPLKEVISIATSKLVFLSLGLDSSSQELTAGSWRSLFVSH